jgi:hypothetical protein
MDAPQYDILCEACQALVDQHADNPTVSSKARSNRLFYDIDHWRSHLTFEALEDLAQRSYHLCTLLLGCLRINSNGSWVPVPEDFKYENIQFEAALRFNDGQKGMTDDIAISGCYVSRNKFISTSAIKKSGVQILSGKLYLFPMV